MATKQEVRAAVEELRRFHRIGTEILKGYGRRVAPSTDETNVMDGIRDRYELKAHMVRAVRRFADPEQGYTKPELGELCKQCGHGVQSVSPEAGIRRDASIRIPTRAPARIAQSRGRSTRIGA